MYRPERIRGSPSAALPPLVTMLRHPLVELPLFLSLLLPLSRRGYQLVPDHSPRARFFFFFTAITSHIYEKIEKHGRVFEK